jgi:uncharacterized damage-inducible protein DinB
MSEAQHLADALESLLVKPDSGWYAVFPQVVACLTPEQAATEPSTGFNSVWKVVNHMAYWQEDFLRFLRDGKVDHLEMGEDWLPVPDPKDDIAWQEAVKRVIDINRQVAEVVESLPDQALDQPIAEGKSKRYQYLMGLIAHNSYHICEIISIRHMQGLWLENV